MRDALELGGGDDRDDAVEPASGLDVDSLKARVRDARAHEDAVRHPGQADVVDVAAAAAEDAVVLDAPDARADEPGCRRRRAHAPGSAAARIAPTMLS
jgi:hypothetical protein